jgi:bile acid:Na+ symporter, BASS family
LIVATAAWFERHSTRVLVASIFVGLGWQDLAEVLRPAVLPFSILTMTFSSVRMDWSLLGGHLRRPLSLAAILLWLLVGAPLLVYGVCTVLLEPSSPLFGGLMLNAVSPPIMAAPAYALIVGAEPVQALLISLGGSALTPFTGPGIIEALGLGAVHLSPGDLLLRLAAMVGSALGLAWLISRAMGRARVVRHGNVLGAITVLLIAGFGIGLMDGMRGRILAEPELVLGYTLAAFGLNGALQIIGALLLWRRSRAQGLVVALVSGNRNMSLMTAAVIDAIGPNVLLYLICTQFPLFCMPLLMRPIFRRFAPGPPP